MNAENDAQSNIAAAVSEREDQIEELSYDLARFRNGSPLSTSSRSGSPGTRGRRRITSANEAEMSEIRLRRLHDEKAVLMQEMELQDEVLRAKDRQLELLDHMIGTLRDPDAVVGGDPKSAGDQTSVTLGGDEEAPFEHEGGDIIETTVEEEEFIKLTERNTAILQSRSPVQRAPHASPLSPAHVEAIRSATSEAKEAREAAKRMEKQVEAMRNELKRLSSGATLVDAADEEIPVLDESDSDDNAQPLSVTMSKGKASGARRSGRKPTPPPMQPPPLPPAGASPIVAASAAAAAAAAGTAPPAPFSAMLRANDVNAKQFQSFLDQEGRGQYLAFWRKCSSLREKYRDRSIPYSDAHDVYTTFMAPGGMMVALPPEILGGVRDVLQAYGHDRQDQGVPSATFTKAQDEVLRLMEVKYYPQFLAIKAQQPSPKSPETMVERFSKDNPMRLPPDTPPQPRPPIPASTSARTTSVPRAVAPQTILAPAPAPKARPPVAAAERTPVEVVQDDPAEPPPSYSAVQKVSTPIEAKTNDRDTGEGKVEEKVAEEPAEFTQVETLATGPTLMDGDWENMQVEKKAEVIIKIPSEQGPFSADEVHMELTALLSAEEIRTLRHEFCTAVVDSREAAKEAARAVRTAEKAAARKVAKAAAAAEGNTAGVEEKKHDGDEKEADENDDDDDEEKEVEEEDEEDPEDGELNCDEFVELVQRLAREAGQRPMPPTKLQKVYVDADEDGNGMLDIDEFIDLYKKVKKGDGPDGLSAPTDVDENTTSKVEYNIKDLEVASVAIKKQNALRCIFEPTIDGEAELMVEVGGTPVHGSPFRVFIYPSPMRFSSEWMSPHNVALKDHNGMADMVVYNTETTDNAYTCAWPSLLRDRPMWWKIFIDNIGSGCYLGIIGGDHHPHDKAHDTHDAYCWQNTNATWMGGEPTRGHQGWKGFENGDECVFKYDPEQEKLMLQLPARLPGKTFMMNCGAPSPQGTRVLVNIRCYKNIQIRLGHGSEDDWNSQSEVEALKSA